MEVNILKDISAEVPMKVIELRIDNLEDDAYILQKNGTTTGIFMELKHVDRIHAHEVYGVFKKKCKYFFMLFFFGIFLFIDFDTDTEIIFQNQNQKTVLSFNATLLYRFSVMVAYFLDGQWRLRWRMVVSADDDIMCFPLCSTMSSNNGVLSWEDQFLNTVLVIGIKPAEMISSISLRDHANRYGSISNQVPNFNGYIGTVSFNKFIDKDEIGECLKPTRYGNTVRFNRMLYASIPRQHEDMPDLFQCGSCPTSRSYHSDVYSEFGELFIAIELGNEKDKLHVKTTGEFEERDGMLHAHAVNGIFNVNDKRVEFFATSMKYFQLAIAYLRYGSFEYKYCMNVNEDGISFGPYQPEIKLILSLIQTH